MSRTLWLCADVAALDARSLEARVAEAARLVRREGLAATQLYLWLRSLSTIDGAAALRLSRALRGTSALEGSALVIGERADLAVLADADGVHVTTHGPDVHAIEAYLRRCGASRIWLSGAVHDPSAARSMARSCAVLLASPFAAVEAKGPPLGIAGLSAIVASAPARRTVALGGVDDAATVARAMAAGARGVAVRRALLSSSWEKSLASIAGALIT